MGVFTWRAIVNRCVPSAGALTEVYEHTRVQFTRRKECFACVVWYGSVPAREHSFRSDIDVYAVIASGRECAARRVLSRIRLFATARNITFPLHVYSEDDVACDPRLFGPSFVAMWPTLRAQGLVLGEPERLATDHYASVQEEMCVRMHRRQILLEQWEGALTSCKQRESEKGWVDEFVRRARRKHTRPLQFCWNLARVLLMHRDGKLNYHSKPTVLAALYEDRRFHALLGMFSDLKLACEEYNVLYTQTRFGEVDEAEYYARLGKILTRAVRVNRQLHERACTLMQIDLAAAVAA